MSVTKSDRQVAKGPWIVPSDAAQDGDGWPFVAPAGVLRDWFAVTLPKTDYNHPSEALGRAYGFEVIDGLRNPSGELGPLHMGLVFAALGQWAKRCNHVGMEAFLHGFGHVLGEYIQTHRADR